MNYTNPMHHTIFNELYLFICIKVQSFNRLDEFIHIICIENKETILIGVISDSNATVRFLMAIKHTYTAEKFKNFAFF